MPASTSTLNFAESVAGRGFAVLAGVFSRDETHFLLKNLVDSSLHRSPAGVRHAMQNPVVASFARDLRLLSLVEEILGGGAFPFQATLFDKSPGANWLVSWHQDTALPIRERRDVPGWGPWSVKDGVTYAHAPASELEKVLVLRISLDDSTEENGPLRVLPGTHRIGVLSDDAIADTARRIREVSCLANCGGVVAMYPLLLHASSKSKVDAPRRVLHIEYAASWQVADGLELASAS